MTVRLAVAAQLFRGCLDNDSATVTEKDAREEPDSWKRASKMALRMADVLIETERDDREAKVETQVENP